jgi:hypothetical protein
MKVLSHLLPIALLPLLFDQAFNPGSLAKFEQIMLPNLFHLSHHTFIAKSIITTHQGGAFLRGKSRNQLPQAG